MASSFILNSSTSADTPGRIRTCDPRFRKPMLYPLSYGGAPSQYPEPRADVQAGRVPGPLSLGGAWRS